MTRKRRDSRGALVISWLRREVSFIRTTAISRSSKYFLVATRETIAEMCPFLPPYASSNRHHSESFMAPRRIIPREYGREERRKRDGVFRRSRHLDAAILLPTVPPVNSFPHRRYHLSARNPAFPQTTHAPARTQRSAAVAPAAEKRCSNRSGDKNARARVLTGRRWQPPSAGHGCRDERGGEKNARTVAFSSFWTTHSKTQCFSVRRVFRLVRLPGKRRE